MMSSNVALRWLSSVRVSWLHATAAFLRGQPLADPLLSAALAAPAERLQTALAEERVPPDRFWSHIVPLAVDIGGMRQLTEVVLTKTVGRQEAEPRIRRFRDLLAEVQDAFEAVLPRLSQEWTTSLEPLRQRWNYHGDGLMGRIVQWTEPGILVDSATIVLVYPALGGGGAAHLPYNLLHIEAQPTDPVGKLPEVVRLGWLLSLLNLDLPRYSEGVRPNHLVTVAGLAMIPITLAAAAELQLVSSDADLARLALQCWLTPSGEADAWARTVSQWWETYCALRPAWGTALQALDRLLEEAHPGVLGEEPVAHATPIAP
jgi:hypothetical protein